MQMALNRGKHRKQSRIVRGIAKVALAGAIVGAPMAIAAAPANASTVNWDAIAQCESSDNWAANTGNVLYGGLQFTESTWLAYGGGQYASSANQASRSAQITVAEKVLAGQGIGAWPVCGKKAGSTASYSGTNTGGSSSSKSSSSAKKSTTTTKKATTPTTTSASTGGSYTVQRGDTLSKIASKQHVSGGWRALWAKNKGAVSNPNHIYVGQKLAL